MSRVPAIGLLGPCFLIVAFARAAEPAVDLSQWGPMCRAIEQTMTRGSGDDFDLYFNREKFLDVVTVGMKPEMIEGFRDGLRAPIGTQIRETVGPAGHFRLVRLHTVNGGPRALFRAFGQQGMNYHDLLLAHDGVNKPCFNDFYVYRSGELMSETIKHMAQQGTPPKPGQAPDPESMALLRLGEVRKLINAYRGREALAVINPMPPKVQQSKMVQLLRINAALQSSEQEFTEALQTYRKLFGDDASADLVSLDLHLMKKNYDEFLAAIDRVDKAVGGDPFLDTLRSACYVAKLDFAAARKCAERSAAADPTLFEPQDALLTAAVKQKDHAATVKQLDVLERNFGMKWKDLRKVGMFAEFVKSPQYQEWAKRHPAS